MQTTSELYRSILADPSHLKQHRLFIGGVEYSHSEIIAGVETAVTWWDQKPEVTGGLFAKGRPAVGCTVSRQIDLMVMPKGTIPRMAEIRLETRLILKDLLTGEITRSSEWIPKGTFFIDTRRQDSGSGALLIHGYDAMLKAEQPYLEDGEDLTGWPKKMPTVMAEIAERIGVELDERNLMRDYLVEAPVGYTMREVAGWIAAAHAGNWTITDAGKLRLVRLKGGGSSDTTSDTTSVLGVAKLGVMVLGNGG